MFWRNDREGVRVFQSMIQESANLFKEKPSPLCLRELLSYFLKRKVGRYTIYQRRPLASLGMELVVGERKRELILNRKVKLGSESLKCMK